MSDSFNEEKLSAPLPSNLKPECLRNCLSSAA